MTIHDATIEAFKHYQALLKNKKIVSKNMSDTNSKVNEMLPHALWMCEECLKKQKDYSLDKLSRWLGFVQAILIFNGLTTIDDERNRTRPWFTKNKQAVE